jgi:hypothetical protein
MPPCYPACLSNQRSQRVPIGDPGLCCVSASGKSSYAAGVAQHSPRSRSAPLGHGAFLTKRNI